MKSLLLFILLLPALLLAESFPSTFPSDMDTVQIGSGVGGAGIILDAGATVQATILTADTDGSLQIGADLAIDLGGNAIYYGAGHSTRADDFLIRSTTTNIVEYDKSGSNLILNSTFVSVGTGSASKIIMKAGATNVAEIALANGDGANEFIGGTSTTAGPSLLMFAGSHASRAKDWVLDDTDNNIIEFDFSGLDLIIGHTTTDILFDGDAMGFFGTTPVAQSGAFTQTFSTADQTVSNATALVLTDSSGGTRDDTVALIDESIDSTSGDGMAAQQITDIDTNMAIVNDNFSEVTTEINLLIADNLDNRSSITAIIDELQAYGLFQ